MPSIKLFLNKIKYSGKFDTKNIILYYHDRILNRLIPIEFDKIKVEDEYLLFEDKTIPLHIIKEIRNKNIIIWKR